MIVLKDGVRPMAAAAVLALALAVVAPAGAQQAAPAAPAQAAPQPEPSATTLAAARDVVVSSGMARSFKPMAPDLAKQIVPTITRTHPELSKDLTEVVQQLEPEFVKDGDRMIDIAAHVYAKHMSEDELKQAATFFRSPAGIRYVEAQPLMLDDLVVAMQSWTQELSNIMMNRVRDEMARRGKSLM